MLYKPELCPATLMESINNYTRFRTPPGGFLRACLENNLLEAVTRADSENLPLLPYIVSYIYDTVPHSLYGSKEIVQKHLDSVRI